MKPRQRNQAQCEPQRLTKAITHIRLIQANPGKLDALDECVHACCQSVTHSKADCLERLQTRDTSHQSQECLFFSRV